MGEFIGEITSVAVCSGKENTACNTVTCNLSKFDGLINMKRRTPDFIAILKYYTTEEGGRSNPARSGYRSQVKFEFEEMQTSGQQVFIEGDGLSG